jgi:hypothetical protein
MTVDELIQLLRDMEAPNAQVEDGDYQPITTVVRRPETGAVCVISEAQ